MPIEKLEPTKNHMTTAMSFLLEQREKHPENFRTRVTEQDYKKGIVDPDAGNYDLTEAKQATALSNAEKMRRNLKESEEETFDSWKGIIYNYAKRLYGIDKDNISDDMLKFKWSKGITPKDLVLSMGREHGLEQITDPSDFMNGE